MAGSNGYSTYEDVTTKNEQNYSNENTAAPPPPPDTNKTVEKSSLVASTIEKNPFLPFDNNGKEKITVPLDLSRIMTVNMHSKERSDNAGDYNIGSFNKFNRSIHFYNRNGDINETPFTIPIDILRNINNYRFKYAPDSRGASIYSVYAKTKKEDGTDGIVEIGQNAVPSLFNPLFAVQITGNTNNTPLLYDALTENQTYINRDIHNCTIKELVRLSHMYGSPLGNAKYKFTDFMYCKDLGKISNNHLITLRKFPYPVPDNIFEITTSKYATPDNVGDAEITGDVGRLITWFGTDDNKLEDILKYNYKATWKELNAERQDKKSQEDESKGPLGFVVNSFSPSFLKSDVQTSTHNVWSKMLGAVMPNGTLPLTTSDEQYVRYTQYDKNKVYTPLNTIQSTHIYEGKLQFSQDISLKFCYKLRGYENINGKSAMIDLLGNILEVTYRRGKFWGGEHNIIGPPPNAQGWKKANAFIDKTFDKLGGIFESLINGSEDLSSLLSQAANAIGETLSKAADAAKDIANDPQGAAKTALEKMSKLGVGQLIRGQLKNALGRPSFYAFDSLLPGGLSGLWHLTIGNPKNPIAAIGNLILDSAEITHSGPLGIDDFPTELTVVVKLKHAKPRDITTIGQMYTKGERGIYLSTRAMKKLDKFYGTNSPSQDFDDRYDAAAASLAASNAKADAAYEEHIKKQTQTGKSGDSNSNVVDTSSEDAANASLNQSNQSNSGETETQTLPPYKNPSGIQNEIDAASKKMLELRVEETNHIVALNGTGDNYLIDNTNFMLAFTNMERTTALRAVIDEVS